MLKFIWRERVTLGVLLALFGFALVGAFSISDRMDDYRNYGDSGCVEQQPPGLQALPPSKHEGGTPEEAEAGQDPGEAARVARVANCLAANANKIAADNLVLTGLMAMFSLAAVAFSALAVIVAVRIDRHRIDAPGNQAGDPAGGASVDTSRGLTTSVGTVLAVALAVRAAFLAVLPRESSDDGPGRS